MQSILISLFQGRVPKLSSKLLGPSQAQVATNCDVRSGKLEPLKGLELSEELAGLQVVDSNGDSVIDSGSDVVITGACNSCFNLEDNWLKWEGEMVSVVKSFLTDVDNRIYFTGDGRPKQTNETMATSGASYTWPTTVYRLGVPKPAAKLTLVPVIPDEEEDIEGAVSYLWTYVTGWGEESAPAEVSETVDIFKIKQKVSITCLAGTTLGGKYFLLATTTQEYYIWYNFAGEAEVTQITCLPATDLVGSEYFKLYSPDDSYYVWLKLLGEYEVTQVTCTAGAALAAKYFTISAPEQDYYVWYYTADGTKEKTTITCKAASTLSGGEHFKIYSPLENYYFWYDIDDGSTDPAAAGTGVEIDIASGDTADQVATKTQAAMDAIYDFEVTLSAPDVTAENVRRGNIVSTQDIDTGFTFAQDVAGTDDTADPDVASKVGIRVDIAVGDTAAEVCETTCGVLDAKTDFEVGAVAEIDYGGGQTEPSVGDSIETATDSGWIIISYTEVAGSWGGNDQTGKIYAYKEATAYEACGFLDNEDITNTTTGDTLAGGAGAGVNGLPGAAEIFRVRNIAKGDVTTTADGAAATSFTIARLTAGTESAEDPSAAGIPIEVEFESDDTSSELATKITAAIHAEADFTAAVDGATVNATCASAGVCTNAADGNTDFDIQVGTAGTAGSTDPDPDGTPIEIEILAADTASDIAEKTKIILDAMSVFGAETATVGKIVITNVTAGKPLEDVEDGDTGFTFSVTHYGSDGTVALSGFVATSVANLNITHARIYRLVTGTSYSEYQMLPCEIDDYVALTAYVVDERVMYKEIAYICIQNGTGKTPDTETAYWTATNADYIIADLVLSGLTDRFKDTELIDVIPTEDWDEPPSDMEGLMEFGNSGLVGFSENEVYFSEPLIPYAWPYSYAFPDTVVGIGRIGQSVIVLTDGVPYALTGFDPAAMDQVPLPFAKTAKGQKSIISTAQGVVYAAKDGLYMINPQGNTLLTGGLYTKEQWEALDLENLISVYYNDTYFGFFFNTGTGITIDLRTSEQTVIDISLPSQTILNYHIDGETLYILAVDATTYAYSVYEWAASSTSLTLVWRSRLFQGLVPMSYAVGRVVESTDNSGSVTFKLYVDGVLKHTESISDDDVFRLPAGYRGDEFSIELEGTSSVDITGAGTSPVELSNG